MAFETYIAQKSAFIFSFDNVLYPEKDYLLQVYYLFAEFMEYTEQLDARAITDFMLEEYTNHGSLDIFKKTASKFDLPLKYKDNFELLHENARLPLKLLPFQKILSFLQEIVVERGDIYLLITGNTSIQLNKIKQLEWHGLEKYLKVYFSEEFEPSLSVKSLDFIIDKYELKKNEILYIGNEINEQEVARNAGVEFLLVSKLL